MTNDMTTESHDCLSQPLQVLCLDGPHQECVVARPNFQRFGEAIVQDEFGLYDRISYTIHEFARCDTDAGTLTWVFPDRGPCVQWESSDLWWAKPLCKVAAMRVYKTWFVATVKDTVPDHHDAIKVMDRIRPRVRRRVAVPAGYVLPIDYVRPPGVEPIRGVSPLQNLFLEWSQTHLAQIAGSLGLPSRILDGKFRLTEFKVGK